MSWDDQERKEDPWKNNRGNEPEDLDAVIRDLQKKFSKFFGGKKFNNGWSNNEIKFEVKNINVFR